MVALSAPEGWTKCLEAPATHGVVRFFATVRFTAFPDSLDNITDV